MKKNWKALSLAGIVAFSMMGFESSAADKEELLNSAVEKMKEISSYSAGMNMDMKMKMLTDGFQMDMIVDGDFAMDITMEPQAVHMDGDMNMEALGQKMDMGMEMYSVPDGDNLEVYVRVDVPGEESGWQRTTGSTAGMDLGKATEFIEELQSEILEELIDEMALADETTQINGRECYKLSGRGTGEMIMPWIDYLKENMPGTITEESGDMLNILDWSKLEVPFELYIDQNENYIVQMTMDMKDAMNSMMTDILAEALIVGDASEGLDMKMTFETCTMTMTMDSFGQVETITVPEEVKKAAEQGTNTGSGVEPLIQQQN